MGAAEELAGRLTTAEAVRRFVSENHEGEARHFDYKSGKDVVSDARGKPKKENVKKILAKALSGFANAEGGVLVWGVQDAKRSPSRKHKPQPFKGYEQLIRYLGEIDVSATSPPVNVQHRAVPASGGKGYVVTHVSASEGEPCMAMFGDVHHRYYRRRSDDTTVMEQYEVADMFGRRPHPKLELGHKVHTDGRWDFHVLLYVRNTGTAVAHSAELHLPQDLPHGYELHGAPETGAVRAIERVRTALPGDLLVRRYRCKRDNIIHVRSQMPFQIIKIIGDPHTIGRTSLVFDYELYCDGMPPVRGQYKVSIVDIVRAFEESKMA